MTSAAEQPAWKKWRRGDAAFELYLDLPEEPHEVSIFCAFTSMTSIE